MAIDLTCTQCKKLLRLNDKLAGKRIKCPSCQTILAVPAAAPAPAPAAATQEVELWHVKTEDEQYHGPFPKAELDRWAADGRLTMNCQVLRDGADQWQWADELFPQLANNPATPSAPSPSPPASSSGKSSKASTPAPPAPAPAPASNADFMWGSVSGEMSSSSMDLSAEMSAPPGIESSVFGSSTDLSAANAAGGGESTEAEASPGFSISPKKGFKTGKGKKSAKPSSIGVASTAVDNSEVSDRSRLTAGLLGLFLGTLGMHRIYLGYIPLGLIMLFTWGGCGVWSLIDAIMILTGKVPDAQGRRLRD